MGRHGNILTSSDGTTWTSRTSGTTNVLYGVTYANSTFVAVGYWGTILTSSDGITWTSRTFGIYNHFKGVVYGNSTFVAVSSQVIGQNSYGTILTSSDNGTSWTTRTSGTSNGLYGVTYGKNTFVAVGRSGTILTSSDGTTWTQTSSISPNKYLKYLEEVGYGNNTFVAVGYWARSNNRGYRIALKIRADRHLYGHLNPRSGFLCTDGAGYWLNGASVPRNLRSSSSSIS